MLNNSKFVFNPHSVFFVVLGLVLVALAWFIFSRILIILSCKGKTSARLHHTEVRVERDLNARGAPHKYYVPVFEYEVEKKVYLAEARWYKNDPQMFEIIEIFNVRYNTDNPKVCYINNKRCINKGVRTLEP